MTLLRGLVNGVYALRRRFDSEETFLRRTLRDSVPSGAHLLDVGCGFSRYHSIVSEASIHYIGVDRNPETVRHGRRLGREIIHEAEFSSQRDRRFDVLLFAHIIEHLAWPELVAFWNRYLPSLTTGGVVIILTPLVHRGFYDDFDHVKPYNPEAIRQALCASTRQTQPFGVAGGYREVNLWLKRDPFWHSHRHRKSVHLTALPMTLLWLLSFGFIGELTGYGMVLRKLE